MYINICTHKAAIGNLHASFWTHCYLQIHRHMNKSLHEYLCLSRHCAHHALCPSHVPSDSKQRRGQRWSYSTVMYLLYVCVHLTVSISAQSILIDRGQGSESLLQEAPYAQGSTAKTKTKKQKNYA